MALAFAIEMLDQSAQVMMEFRRKGTVDPKDSEKLALSAITAAVEMADLLISELKKKKPDMEPPVI